jgi:hypothetical protein
MVVARPGMATAQAWACLSGGVSFLLTDSTSMTAMSHTDAVSEVKARVPPPSLFLLFSFPFSCVVVASVTTRGGGLRRDAW